MKEVVVVRVAVHVDLDPGADVYGTEGNLETTANATLQHRYADEYGEAKVARKGPSSRLGQVVEEKAPPRPGDH